MRQPIYKKAMDKVLQIRLTKQLHVMIKKEAAIKDMPMGELIRFILENHFKKKS